MIKASAPVWKKRFMRLVAIAATAFSVMLMADDDHNKARILMESGDILPLETILENLQTLSEGRVIEVELERSHGRLVYEIEKIDEQGIVREFTFDAVTGELIKEKMED